MKVYNRENYISSDSPIKKDLLRLFKRRERLTIFDIGGCEGEESIRYSRIFPFASIFVFEPLPKNQQMILQNLKKYNRSEIKFIPQAVSDIDGVSEFFVSSGNPETIEDFDWDFGNKSSSLLKPVKENNPKWLKFKEKVEVSTITLEKFLKQNCINEVDFVHMDVQGAELKVLRGAKNYLSKIKSIWLEVADIEIYHGQPLRNHIETYMKKNGFYLVKSKLNGEVGDQLYLNKDYFTSISFLSRYMHFRKS